MDYKEIVELIRREAGGLRGGEAERAAEAVLRVLAERLPRGETRRLLQELPAEMKPWVYTEQDAEALDIDEFLDRIAKREDVDIETAFVYARAVFAALGQALSPETVTHLAASLPQTFGPLVAEAQGRFWDIMPSSQFWAQVGQRLGLDDTAARYVTEAVLETLAERIAAGQVEDLIAQLDPLLHPPLRRGMSSAKPGGRRMPLEEFLRRVAAREGADVDEVGLVYRISEDVRAVFATLAEAVSSKEWFDVTAELPAEYSSVIPPPPV
jgi:uncharacterized protein (DUF2267 family)